MSSWFLSPIRHRLLPTSTNRGKTDKAIHYPDQPQVLAHNPQLLYGLALLPTIIVLASFSFYASLNRYGVLPAYKGLAELVSSNPRVTVQVVTVLGSFLTSAIKWGLSRAITFMAQKRFLEFRTIFEIEFWSSIKNGGILWTWKQNRRRWLGTLITTGLVVLCGLMTSGFVSLLSPLPVQVKRNIAGARELDYMVNTTACSAWLQEVMKIPDYVDTGDSSLNSSSGWYQGNISYVSSKVSLSVTTDSLLRRGGEAGGEAVPDYQAASACLKWHEYEGFTFQTCKTTSQLFDVLEAGRASMLAHVHSTRSSEDRRRFVSTLGRLGNTHILGSTAGVIPMGPGGISAFSVHATHGDPDPARTNHSLATIASYTLTLQGISCDVSCKYVDSSSLPYRFLSTSTSKVDTTCPGGKETTRDIPAGEDVLVMDYCPSGNGTWTFNLASSSIGQSVKEVYAGVGSMSCSVTPRVRNITTTYDSQLDAFIMEPLNDTSGNVNVPIGYFQHANYYTWKIIDAAQVTGSGNILASILDNVAVTRQGLPGMQKDDKYPALVASMIKGIYEYQATHLRLILTAYETRAPDECTRPVTGYATYKVIGWEAQSSTFFALIPHSLIGVAIVTLISWAIWMDEDLKVFDPTSAVSLIATASAGGVHFDAEVVGEADDEVVRNTAVRYQEVGKSESIRWGLMMKGESDGLSFKSGDK